MKGRLFVSVCEAATPVLPLIHRRWLPDGRRNGHEWVVRNRRRVDRHPGSFKINLQPGKWADFAIGEMGGDVISLVADSLGLLQFESATRIAQMPVVPTIRSRHD